MYAVLEVYVLEGCPHCERLIKELEACPELVARGVRLLVVPVLRGPLVRGFTGDTPASRLGDLGGVFPQLRLRLKAGGRSLELVSIGGSEGGLCARLVEAVEMFRSSI